MQYVTLHSPARAPHKVDHVSSPGAIQVDRTAAGCASGPALVAAWSCAGLALLSAHALNQVGRTGAVSCGLLLLLGQALLQRLPLLLGWGVGVGLRVGLKLYKPLTPVTP